MKKKAKATVKPQDNTVTEAAQLVRNQTDRMKLHYAAREQQVTMQTAMLIVSAGAEILQNEYEFTVEQSAAWATETLRAARGKLAELGKEPNDRTDTEV